MAHRVFLSSTFIDLENYRETVRKAIRQLGAIDVSMENLGAREERPLDECVRLVKEESDVFVGIYAHRYGFIPDGSGESITELEYLAAAEAGLPRFIYFIDEKQPWVPAFVDDGELRQKLQSFKTNLSRRHICKTFRNEDNLATCVVADLGRHIAMKETPKVEPGIPVRDIGIDSLRGPVIETEDDWNRRRNEIKTKQRGIFLAHTLQPSSKPDQTFDVFIYLIRHKSEDFSDVRFAEFFLGPHWNNHVFPAVERNGFIGISTSAYGTFLSICRVTFKDNYQIYLERYIDFESHRTGGNAG